MFRQEIKNRKCSNAGNCIPVFQCGRCSSAGRSRAGSHDDKSRMRSWPESDAITKTANKAETGMKTWCRLYSQTVKGTIVLVAIIRLAAVPYHQGWLQLSHQFTRPGDHEYSGSRKIRRGAGSVTATGTALQPAVQLSRGSPSLCSALSALHVCAIPSATAAKVSPW
jgi:hypothetical protein